MNASIAFKIGGVYIGTSATQTKQRWNAEHYVQVKISISTELASAFKSACAASNASMTETLSQFMTKFSNIAKKVRLRLIILQNANAVRL